ncbi:hypothetical protein OsJ_34589 [Oryza sativa Japonica Group]|uniref:Leucine-rich repeat-containing N-terminal plant-type domain-containing protein n=1 Tax=Oryza sativa subsp. japonica TaxID=39947 RepID=B9G8H8_ORYSJ|nr:hypothetical protein OsJ_34589 [Oryza sativa Japonica Group]
MVAARRPRALMLLAAVLLVAVPVAAATLHPVDYLALQAVRRALSDMPGSRFFASWDFTGDPCGFAGVSCSGDGRVVTLALGDPRAGAPGAVPARSPAAGLARLSELASLSLVPGRVIPPSLPLIRSLRTLVLSHNSLSGEIPKLVSSPLVHLDLRNNRLTGGVPPLPATLVYLSLAGNRFSGRVGGVLRRLPRLSFLDLGGNWFSGEVPGEVFSFRISYLQLRKNAFSGELRPSGRVPAGATVDLSHNALSGRVPAELAPAAAVYLNGNKFAGQVPREIAAAAEGGRMRVLFLQDNFLTGIGVGGVPASAAVCAHMNCVAPPPPVVAACPAKGGRGRRRPPSQCGGRRR